MAGESAVDRHAMALAAQDIDGSANIIRGLQTQLEGHKAQVRSQWEGNASMAFETVFNRFNDDFQKVLNALDGMHQALVHTKITYEAKEQEAHEAVNRVHQLLSGG
ncbi:MAG: hypothetical protein QOE54_4199 [Streptosporangiaceae bacterium]|jgi:WXG100 family type VII secretion target|nr:hypothetical protein [Streptosporangiaceae bacterium]MDX6431833.1 hypothetical protein [Streptosporangiaceae bacterium]